MVGVVRGAVAEHLGVDARTTSGCAVELLEHHHARSFAHDEPGARRIERTGGEGRILLLRDEPAHRAEAGQDHRVHAGLRAPDEHHVGVAAPDRLGALADGVRAGGTRGHRGVVRAAQAEVDRDLPARGVDEHVGEEPRRHAGVTALAPDTVLLEDAHDAADRRTDEDARASRIDALDSRVVPGLARRGHRQDDVALEPPRILGPHDGLRLEALHLGCDANRVLARVERTDPVDAAAAPDGRVPRRPGIEPERRDGSETRDCDAPHLRQGSGSGGATRGRGRDYCATGFEPMER